MQPQLYIKMNNNKNNVDVSGKFRRDAVQSIAF